MKQAKALNIPCVAITDYNSISGAIEFIKDCEKQKIKWIVGAKILFRDTAVYTTILAKNYVGWKNLILLISTINRPENIDASGTPTINAEILSKLETDGLICLFEHGYSSQLFEMYKSKFADFYFGLTIIPGVTSDNHINQIREKANNLGVKVVALPSPHYLTEVDDRDHRVLIASRLRTTISKLYEECETKHNEFLQFLQSDQFDLPSLEKMKSRGYTQEELDATNEIASLCEEYKVFSPAKLPKFSIPNPHKNDFEYLKHLCRQGWEQKIAHTIDKEDVPRYIERINAEFTAIQEEPKLASYFLIVADYVNWLKGYSLVGAGRGSVGGSMIAYLLNITDVDPVEYNLLFSRFFNTARKGSLPDIDVDVPIRERENVIEYIRSKYGYENTCQVCTFGRLQGRGVLKEVLRVNGVCSMTEMNKITEFIPDEAKISDDLQEMRDNAKDLGLDDEDPSIIMWALEHQAKELKDWCYLDDEGKLAGPLSLFFAQAIRLEYTLKSQGKHAAAVLISDNPITDTCPLIFDKNKNSQIAGFEYESCEAIGLVKIDILGLACLDKLAAIEKLVNERHFQQELANA